MSFDSMCSRVLNHVVCIASYTVTAALICLGTLLFCFPEGSCSSRLIILVGSRVAGSDNVPITAELYRSVHVLKKTT